MARLVFILLILGLITWFYMGGTNKTVADYKGMSSEQLETLCLEKKDKTACQKYAIDFVNGAKANGGKPQFYAFWHGSTW